MRDFSILDHCQLCPRECGADRNGGRTGYCGMTAEIRAARAALHMWEEPCLSGTRGSGAVFFSGCTLRCVYCQNHEIASGDCGRAVSVERLAEIFLELQAEGAANINLVTACHFVPQVRCALLMAKERGLHLPIVYNSGGYEKVETLRMLEGLADIYLPDFKYMDPETALRYSGAGDYPEKALEAIREMVRQTGPCIFDAEGYLQRGTIVRHLILPGHTKDSMQILDTLYRNFGSTVCVSIMNQYTPLPHVADRPELNRRVTRREYEKVLDHAISIGIENGYFQDGEAAQESFIPAFDFEGL